jgi:hypothetical protein
LIRLILASVIAILLPNLFKKTKIPLIGRIDTPHQSSHPIHIFIHFSTLTFTPTQETALKYPEKDAGGI